MRDNRKAFKFKMRSQFSKMIFSVSPKALLIMIFVFNFLCLNAEVRIVDSETGQPLAKASIFDKSGIFIGTADDEGNIPQNISSLSYPINIRYVGYVPITVTTPQAGTVSMNESSYTLPEIVVNDVSRNILYLQVYVREYHTLDNSKDTVAIFKEQVTDYAIPIGKAKFKGWKKPRLLAENQYKYTKIDKKKSSIDTLSYKEKDNKSITTNFDITQKFKLPVSLVAGEAREYVKEGKYYPEEKWTATEDYYTYDNDGLANNKDHIYTLNFLGLIGGSQTMDDSHYKFERGSKSGVGPENLIEASHNWNMALRGKIMNKASEQKEDTNTSFYSEMFVIDRAYLTTEEAKELKKDAPVIEMNNFKIPEGIPAPPDEVVNLKQSVLESLSKTK